MTGKKLNTYVHVADANGASHVFGPDDTVPDWAVKAITNEAVWETPKATHGTK